MRKGSINLAKQLIQRQYEKNPTAFDQKSDMEAFKLFCTNWLGLQWNELADIRYKTINYPTYERAKRLLASDGLIKLSDKTKKHRHIEETKTIAAIKKPEPKKPIYKYVGNNAYIVGYR